VSGPAGILDTIPVVSFDDPFLVEILESLGAFTRSHDPIQLLPLVGLGGGRTPAGDDILVGVLAGLDLSSEQAQRQCRCALAALLAAAAPHQTTSLSAAIMADAREHRYPEPITGLLGLLAAPKPDTGAVRRAVSTVAAIGHSSGRAFLVGLRVGLGCALPWLGSTCPHS
jgi:hypothetical protein